MKQRIKFYNQGFTLIELLVVIAIIGILSGIVLASLNSIRIKARDVRRIANAKQVQLALELYHDSNNSYPSIGNDNIGYDWSGLTALLGPYIPVIPPDPSGSGWHTVQYVRGSVNENSYGIWMRYEQTGYCKTGVNVNLGWWGVSIPLCQ